ncbi:Dihydroxy-acid dehydratase [Bienertia sinuspersici]
MGSMCTLCFHVDPPIDERVATASMDAIKKFACSPEGIATIFPAGSNETTDLRHLAAKCSSLEEMEVEGEGEEGQIK